MSEIFREVDEDVRKDQALKVWSTYGRYVIGAVVGVILATAGVQYWIYYTTGQREADGEKFIAALNLARAGRPGAAAEQFDALAKDAGAGITTMARLQRAAALVEAGDTLAAVSLYDQISEDGGAHEMLRDLARLLAAQNMIQTQPRAVVDGRLTPLMTPNNPWRFSATELSGLAALRAGDVPGAREAFKLLSDDQATPQGIRSRAAELLAALGDEG